MLLRDIQTQIATRLRAESYFATIPIFAERKADIASEVDIANAKYGACLVVGEATLTGDGGSMGQVTIMLLACENPLVATVGKHADDIAMVALARLFGWNPAEEYLTSFWFTRVEPVADGNEFSAWSVELKTQFLIEAL